MAESRSLKVAREFLAEIVPDYPAETMTREGLLDTPARLIKAWGEYLSGYGVDAVALAKSFADGAEGVDEMVLVANVPVFSHCEHHLAPFFGVAHVAYIPDGRVVGLSKIPRIVDALARRLQVQERLTRQIADTLQDALSPKAVGVVVECRHMCMESRGVRAMGTTTTTSALRGALKDETACRAEFLSLIAQARR